MAFEDIIKKIRENAEKKIKEIELSFEEEKNKIISTANKTIEEIKQIVQVETEKKIQAEKIRLSAAANIELNKEILSEKRKLIDKVFYIAYQKILNLSPAEYRQFIIQLIVRNISIGNEEILLPESYIKKFGKVWYEDYTKELNFALRHSGINSNLKINLNMEISNGFIIKSGKRELNGSLEVILAKYREELEPEVNKILFK